MFGGYRANIQYNLITAYVRDGGHLQIQHRDFFLYGNGNPTLYGIKDYEWVLRSIAQHEALRDMVVVATPTLQFGAIASNYAADASRTVLGTGRVAAEHNRMRNWNEFHLPLTPVPFPLVGAPADAAIIGTGVARVLQLCAALNVSAAECPKPISSPATPATEELPPDIALLAESTRSSQPGNDSAAERPRIELLATTAGGAPNVVSLQVVRAERQGFKELDEVFLVMHLNEAQRLVFGRSTPQATSVQIQLHRTSQLSEARRHVQDLLATHPEGDQLSVLSFGELNPFFGETVQMFDSIFGFIFALIAIIVLFTVGNATSMAVVERTTEIGTIRAMGVRQRGIQRMFLLEGTLLGIVGAASGMLLAVALASLVNAMGLTWLPPGSGVHVPVHLLVWGQFGLLATTAVGLVAVAVFSAWWPARRASRLPIVDALRHT